MSLSFSPRLEILPASQRGLWLELDVVPAEFVLYGGTALALHLGHRISEDFNFFSSLSFNPEQLHARLPFFHRLGRSNAAAWVHYKTDNLEGYVERCGSSVKLAFFGGLHTLQRVQNPLRPAGSKLQVAPLVFWPG